ncbi:hypothetical protein K443DRAFT_678637 [Laccaria amethystina LaAM-08-1]|uniref:Uncharacterized protein n=1 Tax=Laccaria amethystina LaAM-08-1 TaxID=1095629 RepID=A0A0C9WRG6_9AGAR|nr:hypothetical protein K443DRAFT_678637 [Laccaria amethystina LaAM-08-1]
MDASNKGVPSNLISLPSLSSSLHALPHATSLQGVSLHPNMYAQRAAESEAKLQKALSKTASNYPQQNSPMVPAYMMPPPSQPYDPSSPLMMRRKTKFST